MKYGNQVISSIRLGSQAIITKIAKGLTIVYEAWKTLIQRGKTPLTITSCQPDTTAIDYTIYGGNDFKSILPDEYQQVEYIKTTGTQYIDSGVPLNNKLKTVVDWIYEETASANSYTGGHIGSPGNRWLIGSQRQNNIYFFAVGTGNTSTGFKFGDRDVVEAYWEDKASYIKVNGVQSTASFNHLALVGEPSYTFYMGAVNRDGNAGSKSKLTIYNWKFYQDDILIRDYIPCYRKSDRVAGLYDVVTNEFYTNDGTGEFIVGEPIFPSPTPDAPIEMKGVGDRTNNLIDFSVDKIDKYVYNTSGDTRYGFDLGVLPQDSYTLSVLFKEDSYVAYIYLRDLKTDGTWGNIYVTTNTQYNSPTTFEADGTSHYYLILASSAIDTLAEAEDSWNLIDKIWLEKGTESTECEPYGYKIPIKIKREVLPVEYQRVEYIEATGTQYIDANFCPDSNSSIEIDVLMKDVSYTNDRNGFVFGVNNSDNTKRFGVNLFYSNGRKVLEAYPRFSTNAPAGGHQDVKPINLEQWYNIRLDKGTYYIDNTLWTSYSSTFEKGEYSLYINGYNNNGVVKLDHTAISKIKSCKIWDNDALVRDMIPCYRKSDDVVGMYDLVNGVFYTNAGTGAFLIGNEVKDLKTTAYLDRPINKVGTCMDSLSYKTQSIIKPLGHYQFDGSENWEEHTTAKGCKVYRLDGVLTPKAGALLSDTYMTHFGLTYIYSTADFIPGFYRFASGNPVNIISAGSSRLYISSTCETVEEFKEWLSVNKPNVYYPLAEPETINIELPELYLPDETNIITVDTEVSPDAIEITYKGRE